MNPTKQKSFLSQIKNAVHADSIGRNRAGNVVLRDSFFYRHGRSAEGFAEAVKKQLVAANIAARVVDCGEKYADFRGGSTVAQGSHFWVEVAPTLPAHVAADMDAGAREQFGAVLS